MHKKWQALPSGSTGRAIHYFVQRKTFMLRDDLRLSSAAPAVDHDREVGCRPTPATCDRWGHVCIPGLVPGVRDQRERKQKSFPASSA
jgi:hypothetical protein